MLEISSSETLYDFQRIARASVVVKALSYKPEGRGFDTRWGDFYKFT
jgi:hypothetical protein